MSNLLRIQPATLFEVRQVAAAGQLFAILDACDAPAVPPKVESLGDARALSLYRGNAEEVYTEIAPYLVAVDSELLDWILETVWDDAWGIFAQSEATLEELRTHFRKFLTVKSPEGEDWYFRYYDPRVLAKFLPTCNDNELAQFYGPVQAYGVTDEDSGSVRWLRPLSTPAARASVRLALSPP